MSAVLVFFFGARLIGNEMQNGGQSDKLVIAPDCPSFYILFLSRRALDKKKRTALVAVSPQCQTIYTPMSFCEKAEDPSHAWSLSLARCCYTMNPYKLAQTATLLLLLLVSRTSSMFHADWYVSQANNGRITNSSRQHASVSAAFVSAKNEK